MRKAIDDYYADKRQYPVGLEELVRNKYLRIVPHDPITESARTWIPVRAGEGMYDVHSGAAGKSCDGTLYRDW